MSIGIHGLKIMTCATVVLALAACSDPGSEPSNDPGSAQNTPAAQTPDTSGNSAEIGQDAEPLSESFRATCKNITLDDTTFPGDIHVRCACRQRNGVFVNAGFDGSCFSDLANCDGILRCGRC